MNCPSRTDDDVLLNPGWNQSPPRFAADLTTCEDLNGIANARELGEADRLSRGSRSLRRCELQDRNAHEIEKDRWALGEGVKGSFKGLFGPQRIRGSDRANLVVGPCTRTSTLESSNEHRVGHTTTSSFTDWAKWLLSVLCTSLLISYTSGALPNIQMASSKFNRVCTWSDQRSSSFSCMH